MLTQLMLLHTTHDAAYAHGLDGMHPFVSSYVHLPVCKFHYQIKCREPSELIHLPQS